MDKIAVITYCRFTECERQNEVLGVFTDEEQMKTALSQIIEKVEGTYNEEFGDEWGCETTEDSFYHFYSPTDWFETFVEVLRMEPNTIKS